MVCGPFWCCGFCFSQRLCHKAVYIRHFGGTRELKTRPLPIIHLFCVPAVIPVMCSFFSSTTSAWRVQVWFCSCATALRLKNWTVGWADSRETLFCLESHLWEGTMLMRRMENCTTNYNDKIGLGVSNQMIFSTDSPTVALSPGGSFSNGWGGWRIPSVLLLQTIP